MNIETTVDRVRASLEKHAPELLEGWQPPASDADVQAAESSLGHPIPESMLQLLRIHDGTDEEPLLFARWNLLSAMDAANEHATNLECMPDDWEPGYTPLAGDGSGNFIVVDESGAVFEFANDGEPRDVHRASSIPELFERFADELDAGRVIRDEEPGYYRWVGYDECADDE